MRSGEGKLFEIRTIKSDRKMGTCRERLRRARNRIKPVDHHPWEENMVNLTKQLKTVALAAALATGGTLASAQDKEPIRFGLCFDLSKSYTFISPQVAQAS